MEPPRVLNPLETVLSPDDAWPLAARCQWALRVSRLWVMRRLGMPASVDTPDRRMLESRILPYLAQRDDVRRVLFVGVDWYTQSYERLFSAGSYSTLDIDPSVARYGSRVRHIVDTAQNASLHFGEGSLDLIVFNGVFGWGLNGRSEMECTLKGFHRLLREGGVLLIGWNDVARYRPFALSECHALQGFERWRFPPLGSSQVRLQTDNRHCFEFFRRPTARAAFA